MRTAIPNPGLGTFRLKGDALKSAVTESLDLGYRHIDTAQIYENEDEIGNLLSASGIDRSDLFITTKVWYGNLARDKFIPSVRESLTKLRTDYVDLLLIHWPSPGEEVPMQEYISELVEAKKLGLAREIGISNFTIEQVKHAIGIAGKGEILTNQVEVHPFLQNDAVVEFCQRNGIEVTGFMPLAVGKVLEDDTLRKIAENHNARIPEVVLAWLRQRDIVAIPSSTKRAHLASNLKGMDLVLSDDELSEITMLNSNHRIANPDFAPIWDQ
ncbi:2,5-didehydrogluconate reductase DkgB [Marinobacter adhaerens]|jgi:2,5-diketo-D-gluconate reductase B|uniref:2,5-didehydrogluconate reductase DkgB n=1 Tax=Marinobacter adhaerens TaxID=1033846 RepID=UPI003BAC2991